MTGYLARSLGDSVREALVEMPVVVVTGLRQAGKSTFLQQEPGLSGRRYVSLDDLAQLTAARGDPEGFVRSDEPLTIDEAQRCPELLTAVKRAVDRDRRPGRYLLSGSANFALLRQVSESLAGRAVYLTLHPFTRRELAGENEREPFLMRAFRDGKPPKAEPGKRVTKAEILAGGLPPVCLRQVKRELWFRGYEQTYLERDVRELARLGDLTSFRSLLHLAALRTAKVLSIANLARDAKVSHATATRHLDLLEASFVVNRLPPFLKSEASRLIKSPKLFLSDSGLASFLTGPSEDDSEPLDGALLETYVAQNLRGILESHWPGARLSYWHVQGRHEVDFVIEFGRDCMAIEVKAGARWNDGDLTGLRALMERTPRCKLALLTYGGDELVAVGERAWAVPLAALLR